jgi:asparagine synthase (glutamine-hydrolysing)
MFALVYIDLKSREIIITRDKHGIIPLFIYQADNEIIISSSISGIEESKRVNLSLNETAVEEYLAFRHVLGSKSFYNEIRSIVPGETLIIDATFICTHSTIAENTKRNQRSLKEILLDSLSLIKESYHQPGILLSGGVDSTLLLALLNRELGERELKTYTLNTGPDARWAKKAAEQYGAHHLEIPVNSEMLNRADEYLFNMDQPIGDHGAFAVWLVAEQAVKESNVLLSGAGADELFGGYNRHRAFHFYLKNKSALMLYKEFAKKTGTRAILPKNVKNVIKSIEQDPRHTYLNFLQLYAINTIIKPNLLDSLPDNMENALEFDRKNYLVNDVLAISNNSAMQHNLEVRVPYLFDDVVQKAAAISVEQRMKHRGKGPLKDILINLEGESYTRRKKMGFGLPLEEWFRDDRTAGIWEFLKNDNPIFKYVPQPRIFDMIRLHQAGKRDYHMELWSILVLAKWLNRKL